MSGYKKTFIFICLILTLMISLYSTVLGGEKITIMFSTNELKNIKLSGEVCISDDSPASIFWVPQNPQNTLSDIVALMLQTKQYKGKIQKSQISPAMFKANIEPSILYINTSDKKLITIQPAFYLSSKKGVYSGVVYITNVLRLTKGKQVSYVENAKLYNWLKNNKWKTKFEMEH
jgi:hypothetical protein